MRPDRFELAALANEPEYAKELATMRQHYDADAGEDPGSQRKGRSKAANALESVNRSLRKISKNRGVFPHQEALLKLYYLALDRIAKQWTLPIPNWNEALNRFAIEFGDRMPKLA